MSWVKGRHWQSSTSKRPSTLRSSMPGWSPVRLIIMRQQLKLKHVKHSVHLFGWPKSSSTPFPTRCLGHVGHAKNRGELWLVKLALHFASPWTRPTWRFRWCRESNFFSEKFSVHEFTMRCRSCSPVILEQVLLSAPTLAVTREWLIQYMSEPTKGRLWLSWLDCMWLDRKKRTPASTCLTVTTI